MSITGNSAHLLRKTVALLLSQLIVFLFFSNLVYGQTDTTNTNGLGSDYDIYNISLEDLLNIEVSVASKFSEKLTDAPGVISVVTKDDIQRFGGTTLKDILERVPSITVQSSSFTDQITLASRGDMVKSTASHILILIDGRPTREIVEGGVITEMLAAFPVNIIERIEVIRGPGSTLYGSNAISAVINIVTIQSDQNSLEYTEVTGQNNANGRAVTSTINHNGLKATVGLRMLEKAHTEVSFLAAERDFATRQIIDTVTRTKTVHDVSLAAFASIEFKKLNFTTSIQDYNGPFFNQGMVGHSKWTKNFFNLGYEAEITPKWTSALNATYNYATLKTDTFPDIHRRSNDFVGEWTNLVRISDKMNFTVGALYNYMEGRENSTDPDALLDTISFNQRNAFGGYTQLDYWPVIDKLKLTAGLQANKMERLDLDVVPRFGIIWHLTPKINIKSLYGQAYRAGSINETGINYLDAFIGNPDLKPEKVETIDFGINYQTSNSFVGINYFHSTQSNSIKMGIDKGVLTYINIQNFTFDGIELETKHYLHEKIFFTGSLLYQKLSADPYFTQSMFSEGRDTNYIYTTIPDLSFKAGISYASDNGITVGLFDIYQGELTANYPGLDGLTPSPLKSYNILNLNLNIDVVRFLDLKTDRKISAFMQQENVLDKEIWQLNGANNEYTSTPVNTGRKVYFGITVGL